MNIVKPQATFKQVLEAMGYDKKTNLPSGFAVVVDERSQVVGVISDSDIRKQLIVSEDIQSERFYLHL
jgi:CBS domain-containing protein